ncbi:MAG: ABC transporter permease [Candidatus Dojkabacteria bacterium]
MKKLFNVALFEYTKTVKKPSFWASTLFLPVFIALVTFISSYSSIDASKKIENMETFSKIYLIDDANVIQKEMIVEPLEAVKSIDEVKRSLMDDSKRVLIHFPENFLTDFHYDIYFKDKGDVLRSANTPLIADSLLKNSAISNIQNNTSKSILSNNFKSTTYSYDSEGQLKEEGLEKFVLPVLSLIVFFMAVFISSSFLLQSVSAEKENRMIETMLSIVDKKSLMIGKMVGLIGVVITQLLVWLLFGVALYLAIMNYFDLNLPIDLNNIDWGGLPLNIFLIITGFLFFAAVMVGVGAVGTGAEDSRNLSSIFIILSIFPMYLMQSLITDPTSLLSRIFSYFPFTSFMVLLLRNSIGALSTQELIIGIFTSIIYVIIAIFISMKLFELGCLMYNRRPSLKEIFTYFK